MTQARRVRFVLAMAGSLVMGLLISLVTAATGWSVYAVGVPALVVYVFFVLPWIEWRTVRPSKWPRR